MRHRRSALLFLLPLLAAPSLHVRAGETYQIDSARSIVSFSVHQFLGTTKGRFGEVVGRLEVDREHPENSTVAAQIKIKSLATGIRKRDDHLIGPEFFDVAKYPEIAFKSRRVRQTGPQSGEIEGDLTMHGVKRPVTLRVALITLAGQGESPAVTRTRWAVTTAPLSRSAFHLAFSRTAEALSGISQEVKVDLEIEATSVSQ